MVLLAVASLVLSIGPAGAITFGQPDGNRHPNVGALLTDYDPDSPGPPATRGAGPATRPTGSTPQPPETSSTTSSRCPEQKPVTINSTNLPRRTSSSAR
jgi:hypothetical protein